MKIGMGLSIGNRAPGGLSRLFLSSDIGDFGYARTTGKLWQDTAGTTPVTASGDPVARMDGERGVLSLRQSTGAARPLYNLTSSLHSLSFDGAAQWLVTASNFDMTGVNAVTVVLALRKASDALAAFAFNHNSTAAGSWRISAPPSAAAQYATLAGGTTTVASTKGGFAAPITNVVTLRATIATPILETRVNGAADASPVTTTQGAGNFSSGLLALGARSTGASFFNGSVYAWFVIGRALTDTECRAVEASFAGVSGVTIA
jgi:hypothetical protein